MNEPSETNRVEANAVGRDTRAAFSARTGGLECVLSVAAPDIENLSPLVPSARVHSQSYLTESSSLNFSREREREKERGRERERERERNRGFAIRYFVIFNASCILVIDSVKNEKLARFSFFIVPRVRLLKNDSTE